MVLSCRKDGERRLTKEIYKADVGGNAGRGRPKRKFLHQIGEVLEKGQVRSTQSASVYEEFDDSGRSERCL
jgi:hypothetical protein